jgi:hypothetical protein
MTTNVLERPSDTLRLHPEWKFPRSKFSSVFLSALIAYVIVNCLYSYCDRSFLNRRPEHTNAGTVLSHYRAITKTPDVVIMGSSIVKFPFWMSDQLHSGGVPKFDDFGWCAQLEQLVFKEGKKPLTIFDFGIHAAMASDVYLCCDRYFDNDHRPKLIIYGVSPRDFMDSLLPKETDTESFKRLYSMTDVLAPGSLFQTNLEEKGELTIRKKIPLYRYRRWWQERVDSLAKKAETKLFRKSSLDLFSFLQSTEAAPGIPPEPPKVAPGWIPSVAEYEARYARFDYPQMARQERFFEALLDMCKHRHIRLLIVNMPLTRAHEELMPPGLLAQYNSWLQVTALNKGTEFIDLQSAPEFSDASFFDIVHLNGHGGDQLSQYLLPKIVDAVRH